MLKTQTTVKELAVLAGHLAHASQVVKGGRTFSRRILNLYKYYHAHVRPIVLPDWFRSDLKWWDSMCKAFNGKASILNQPE